MSCATITIRLYPGFRVPGTIPEIVPLLIDGDWLERNAVTRDASIVETMREENSILKEKLKAMEAKLNDKGIDLSALHTRNSSPCNSDKLTETELKVPSHHLPHGGFTPLNWFTAAKTCHGRKESAH